jgi:2-oxoglutarate dehydrogenase E1 component
LMYKAIHTLPTTRERYAQHLLERGVLGDATALVDAYRQSLDAAPLTAIKRPPSQWDDFARHDWQTPAVTAVAHARLHALAVKIAAIPAGITLHARVAAIQAARLKMATGAQSLDWGMAELLAYASLLAEGHGVRLSGQDSERGTFFHRHAVLHDQARTRWDRGEYSVLAAVGTEGARFEVVNSLLSEEAVLAFEYGYAGVASADSLVIWEAQFGDFVNGAQVVIDQFIASGETKWGRLNGLTLLLPHGYEGQGPEHSSARIERFLQLAAEDNMQIVQPSLPAQFFHLMRRQIVRPYRKPLIVLTPKSLLRHPAAVSSLDDLALGAFQPVLDEVTDLDPQQVRRVVVCSGRVYFDLATARRERGLQDIAIVRIEQFYPFPDAAFLAVIGRYPKGVEIVWAQDEPKNQGAWPYMLRQLLRFNLSWRYAGRPHSASPATGFAAEHKRQLDALIAEALG